MSNFKLDIHASDDAPRRLATVERFTMSCERGPRGCRFAVTGIELKDQKVPPEVVEHDLLALAVQIGSAVFGMQKWKPLPPDLSEFLLFDEDDEDQEEEVVKC